MTKAALQVPNRMLKHQNDTICFIAAKLYESGKLTLGEAAETAGMKKWSFAEVLIQHGVHYLDPSAAAAIEGARR